MGNRRLENNLKKKWVCKHGCDISTSVCEHIEELLPSMNSGQYYNSGSGSRAKLTYIQDVDWLGPHLSATVHPEITEIKFKQLLDEAPLTTLEKDVLSLRFIDGTTFKRIAEILYFAGGARTVSNVYKHALKKMKAYYEA